jgi:hypothetical protein
MVILLGIGREFLLLLVNLGVVGLLGILLTGQKPLHTRCSKQMSFEVS